MMPSSPRILIAQINPTVGAIQENAKKIISIIQSYAETHDIILFPELALSGYPPEDLLFQDDFHTTLLTHLNDIRQHTPDCHVIVGYPEKQKNHLYNAAGVFYQGKTLTHYHKQKLPNTGVFDEKRYFTPGEAKPCIITIKGIRFGILICEDLWQRGPVEQLSHAEISCILSLNASPFDHTKPQKRINLLKNITQHQLTVVYANLVGGQDELVFDGQSMVMSPSGQIQAQAAPFEEAHLSIVLGQSYPPPIQQSIEALLYQALVIATRDYLNKNGFKKALLGLSGGIDSALTLCIAVDAIGAENVTVVRMPSRYTQNMSLEDAEHQIKALQVAQHTLSIEGPFQSFLTTLKPAFEKTEGPLSLTAENIQARVRGVMLMALSNETNALVLTTTNKSELAMGYGTLYGDMAGGFAVLKDLYKTQVYQLAHYRNTLQNVIPDRVFTRPPSAELAPDQTDQDTLPPYEHLDAVIQAYMEKHYSRAQLHKTHPQPNIVDFVIRRIYQNDYKRQQAPLGPKLSPCAFGKDWRFPITKKIETKL